MTTCPACSAELPAGIRWCTICHRNVLKPELGRLAPPAKRLIAYFLDLSVPLIALFLIFIVAGATGAQGGDTAGIVVGFTLLATYLAAAFWLFSRGSTPGKRLLGMWVVREEGDRAGLATMVMREWIGKTISGMVFSLGFLWILMDRDNQGWHDKLVSTYVIG